MRASSAAEAADIVGVIAVLVSYVGWISGGVQLFCDYRSRSWNNREEIIFARFVLSLPFLAVLIIHWWGSRGASLNPDFPPIGVTVLDMVYIFLVFIGFWNGIALALNVYKR